MLRESVETHDQDVDLNVLVQGGDAGDIEFHRQLTAFAEAIVGTDDNSLTLARDTLINAAGSDVMVDAAGVASNFQRMVRIADSTGIELGDETVTAGTAELRDTLGINDFKKAT